MGRRLHNPIPIHEHEECFYRFLYELQIMIKDAMDDCEKFDKGNVQAGMRFKRKLNNMILHLKMMCREYPRTVFYREALRQFQGKINYIDRIKAKEWKYGKVADVAKFQILQKCEAYAKKRNERNNRNVAVRKNKHNKSN